MKRGGREEVSVGARCSPWERGLVVVACALVGWFYTWTARSSDPWWFGLEQRDYYNLLVDGWLDGQLHMKVEVPRELLELPDPYDPRLRPPDLGLHDASFYKGKYFVYFGVAPVVAVMLPFRVLTGIDLPLAAAVLVFAYAGFLASAGIWLGVRRRYFPGAGALLTSGMVLVLGLVNLGPVLLRRPHMWELPIAAGYCFATVALGCVWRGLHVDAGRRARWMAGAGLFLGLAIASRPTYLLASPFLLVPLVLWWRERKAAPWREAMTLAAPLAAIGLLMAWHNHARFDHPLQFGQAYQFSLDYESKVEHFSTRYLGFNTWRYFLSRAEWSAAYPFIAPAELPPKPPGFSGHDDVYGVLTNLPLAWLALAAPLALWRRSLDERRRLGAWLGAAAVLFGVMAGVLLCFFGSLARYQVDFAPTLMLLAGVGVLAVDRWLQATASPGGRNAWRAVALATTVVSAVFAILFSLQMNRFLRHRNPAADREVGALLDRGPELIARMFGHEVERNREGRRGAAMTGGRILRMRVKFPAGKTGAREPLLTTGATGRGDVLLVEYIDPHTVRFELDHWGAAGWRSEPVTVNTAEAVDLEIALPSLASPAAGEFARAGQRGRVFVRVNGTLAWARPVEFHAAAADEVYVGRNPIGATSCGPAFTGEIVAAQRADR